MIDTGAPYDSVSLISHHDLHRPVIIEQVPAALSVAKMAPAREPHFAEREELDAALAAGTREALLLFTERHPQSRYRPEADSALRQRGVAPPSR
jgi:hypothetical protein